MNFTIVGAGNIGVQLTKRLAIEKHDITIIENNPVNANYVREHLDALIVEGDATFQSVQKAAGVQNNDVFAAMTSNDLVNLISCRIAKNLGAVTTICRVRNPEYKSEDYVVQKEDFGVDYMIHPERETADAIIRLVYQSGSTDVIEFEKGIVQLSGIRLDKDAPVLNIPLMELGASFDNPNIRIVAIKRGQFTVIPRGQDYLKKGDQIFVIYDENLKEKIKEYFGKKDVNLKNILIIGGGQIGRFIAEEFQHELNVKIIELREGKAHNLAETLRKALVIHGDGSDLDLLTFENLTDMDEFIAVTGDDETNIITSIVARHLEVPRTITLIAKNEYLPLTPALGMDAVVSKQQITVNAILNYIKRTKIAYMAEIPGVDAEITEYIVPAKAKITRKPLKDLYFPEGAIVGAVIRNDKDLIIPTGNTHITENDKVIVFSLPRAVSNVEKFFK